MNSGWIRLFLGSLLMVGLVIQENTTEANTTAAPTPNGAQNVSEATTPQDNPKENNAGENEDYCDPSLCLNGKRHVACYASTELHERCSLDAELVTITDKLRTFITHGFNQLPDTAGGNNTTPMATLTWDSELSHLAEYNVKKCLYEADDCVNTKKYKHVAQIIGYRGLKRNLTNLEDILGDIGNGWLWTRSSSSMADTINEVDAMAKPPKQNLLQMVVENAKYVGCAVLQQSRNGWFQTFFTCNFDVAPTKGAPTSKAARTRHKFNYYSSQLENRSKIQGRSGTQLTDGGEAISAIGDGNTGGAPPDKAKKKTTEGATTQASYLDKSTLQKKFARFLKLMKKAKLNREQRNIVVITSNHEIEDTDLPETANNEG